MSTTKIKMKKRMVHAAGFILCLQWLTAPLWADISGLFPGSLAHQASGLFKWTAWDYVTNPYIYSQQKKDVISAVFTPNFRRGALALGGKVTLWGFPLFLAFSHNNQGLKIEIRDPGTARDGQGVNTANQDIRIMLGSVLPLPWWSLPDLGIGVYYRGNTLELINQEGVDTLLPSAISDESRLSGNTYGIQFGVFQSYADSKNSFASTINVEYVDLGGEPFNVEGGATIDSPRLDTYQYSDIFNGVYSANDTGRRREEININYLGWLPVHDSADAGLSINFTLPFGEGADTREGESDNAKLSGIGLSAALFYDKDFLIDINTPETTPLRSIFRIQPVLSYVKKSEEVNFDSGKAFSIEEDIVLAALNFKYILYLNEKKTFSLLMSWGPLIYPHNEYKEQIKDSTDSEVREAIYKEDFLRVNLSSYTLGFAYDFTESLSFYFNLGTARSTGSVVVSPKDFKPTRTINTAGTAVSTTIGANEQLNITNISFGADYQF